MPRPVWLFSMDTEQFNAPPMTTGALEAYHRAYGHTAAETEIELVHFLRLADINRWLEGPWRDRILDDARAAAAAGLGPIFGLSCYTWNMAEFLELARLFKRAVPGALVVAGGPHVQRAEDFLLDEAIDLIVLGEGEVTFSELLDCPSRSAWTDIPGCAFLVDGRVHQSTPRARMTKLDAFPSALDVIALRDADGEPLYRHVAYETTRGCPYDCAFCEWGTGAIGTKMFQFSLPRIRDDFERLVAGGIVDIWLADSNFGALREDEAKAELVVDLRRRTGLPQTFATSWSKNHNQRVQRIVRLLHRHGLLVTYHLALQTLTPRALELAHRTNMRANDYEPIVKQLAAEGVPVAAELIWPLPGDTLAEFEANLERLMAVFPNITIFAYTLLPGTEFYDRRAEYALETVPVAGYGKAKGEYVVGSHTMPRDEAEQGYFLLTAYTTLARGYLMNLTVRYLALSRRVPVGRLLRHTLEALLEAFGLERAPLLAYEQRAENYLRFVAERERVFEVIGEVLASELAAAGAADLAEPVLRTLALDEALCPRTGAPADIVRQFDFAAGRVIQALTAMDLPEPTALSGGAGVALTFDHPGRVGEVLRDPDGGEWMRGRVRRGAEQATSQAC